ncbi:MAG TPA: polyprenol monophosphomannose synthase [Solirubrobacterales bacterium]|jgi:dolichol-phosphate mannosyltransferase|nr:polyprenol monophosphomannose synthase [Solirubrobacterales bacterium]
MPHSPPVDACVWLVLPTYNEAENIGPIVVAATQRLSEVARDHVVLIVDDNSPDGTGEAADHLAKNYESVRVLHRAGKEGLGRAYLAGFDVALAEGADMIVEMDADFSHDPRDLGRLIRAAATDCDLAIGSRYVPGGGVRDWSLGRRILSRAGGQYARRILGIDVQDLTGGFKCFRREALEAIELDKVISNGYGFQIELTYRAIRAGMRVREVPIWFTERRAGESKMSPRIAVEAALRVPGLKRRIDAETGAVTPAASREPVS